VVETDRQTDLCSEHALTPGFSSGLVAVQVPDLGHRMGGQWWIPRVPVGNPDPLTNEAESDDAAAR